MRTPQVLGREWEREFARSIGGRPVPGSGAGFTKMDVHGSGIVWGLRWHGNSTSFQCSDHMMAEVLHAIYGPGGVGVGWIPALAFKTIANEYLVFRKNDALMLMTEESAHSVATPRAIRAIDRSRRIPEFLKGIE